jgi:rSAM/selenodomain-associated transferase 1
MTYETGVQILVIAKAPVPGSVKTRMCPPCTPRQAAAIAAAALTDTLLEASRFPAFRRVLVLASAPDTADVEAYVVPPGWQVVEQHGVGLGRRLAHAFLDTALPDVPSLLIGMDTPQVSTTAVAAVASGLVDADAVLAPALDGGWWALALRDPRHARVLADVPMSTAQTGALTAAALRDLGLRVAYGPPLRDVDSAADAIAVAAECPAGRFAAAVRCHMTALEPA